MEEFQEHEAADKADPDQSYVGLSGRALFEWALDRGPSCLDDIGPLQRRYFEARSRRVGVDWPDDFFKSTIEKLTDLG